MLAVLVVPHDVLQHGPGLVELVQELLVRLIVAPDLVRELLKGPSLCT